MFSNAIGDPAICQYMACSDCPSDEEEATAEEGGNGDLPSEGICGDQYRLMSGKAYDVGSSQNPFSDFRK